MKRIGSYVIAVVAGLIFSISSVSGQGPVKAYIDFAIFDEDNAVALDSTNIYVQVRVKSANTNADTSVNGNLMYWFQTGKMIEDQGPTYFLPIDNDPNYETIPLGGVLDTIKFFCDTTYLDPRTSETGPVNVIIIWPAFDGTVLLQDSGMYVFPSIMVENPWIGIEEEHGMLKGASTIYPNPAQGEEIVYLNSKHKSPISKFAIINSIGQTVSFRVFDDLESGNGYIVPTSDLRPGLYYIQVFYEDSRQESVKFIKH